MSSSDIYEYEFIVIPFGVADNNPFNISNNYKLIVQHR